jgi:hypothetical protein
VPILRVRVAELVSAAHVRGRRSGRRARDQPPFLQLRIQFDGFGVSSPHTPDGM